MTRRHRVTARHRRRSSSSPSPSRTAPSKDRIKKSVLCRAGDAGAATSHRSAALAASRAQRLRRRRRARDAVERCKREGFVDDRLYATLYVERKRKPVGDSRLVGELVRKGIDGDAATRRRRIARERRSIALPERLRSPARQECRDLAYPSAARRLERLGFPAATIYRVLREHAGKSRSVSCGKRTTIT